MPEWSSSPSDRMEPSQRQALGVALRAAIKARQPVAVAALRSAMSAIDNAEAVPVPDPPPSGDGPIAGAVVGLGAAEVDRRALSPAEVMTVVQREIDERLAVAADYDRLGRTEEAATRRAEAAVLVEHVQATPAQ
jgi:uncharacterized protein YqeY